jgi:hypothetical protein
VHSRAPYAEDRLRSRTDTEVNSIFNAVAESGSKENRPCGHALWGAISLEEDGIDTLISIEQQAIAMEPGNVLAHSHLARAGI